MSKKVLSYYPDIKPVKRAKVELPLNLNPYWAVPQQDLYLVMEGQY